MESSVVVYDTTLRDGAQGEGVSFSVADKLEVVSRLDQLGVDYIEGGWPGSNSKDLEFFYALRSLPLHHAKVVAFTSTRRKGALIEEDEHMQLVLGTGLRHCAVVGKTWDFQVREALRTELAENLAMIRDTISFLKDKGIEALFDAEHFFDGYKENPAYALATLAAARDAGADWLILCDTNGGALPEEVERIVQEVRAAGFVNLGIHTHNDGGLAIANSLAAVRAGVTQVQGTINGYGERCGNADLCVLLPNLVLKYGYETSIGKVGISELRTLSERLYEMTAKTPAANQPFVGKSAFAHKAGIHVSAIRRNPRLYEHVAPELVGNERRVLLSELSGASNVYFKLDHMGLAASGEAVTRILARLKDAERTGYVFEDAETSLELLIREELELDLTRMQLVREVVDTNREGFSAHVEWLENGTLARRVQGVGGTVGLAFCAALDLLNDSFALTGEEVWALAVDGTQVFRARVRCTWHERALCTVGIGSSRTSALAMALLQVYQYIHLTATLSGASSRV